ncbi:hypothetical protein SNEBB_007902 [Seison nebaliae]|nr:hypothetical protein SNEBB_007902 [Seison nebaliae]
MTHGGLLDDCHKYFKERDLYKLFDCKRNCNGQEIRRSNANEKFQTISKCYDILSNDETRKHYDETGKILNDDDLSTLTISEILKQRFNTFKHFDLADLEKFEIEYKNTKDEMEDLLSNYEKCKGNPDLFLLHMPYSTPLEFQRYYHLIQPYVDKEEIKNYRKFFLDSIQLEKFIKKWEKREKKNEKIFEDFIGKEIRNNEHNENTSLYSAIRKRGCDRMTDLVNSLESKYATKSRKRK